MYTMDPLHWRWQDERRMGCRRGGLEIPIKLQEVDVYRKFGMGFEAYAFERVHHPTTCHLKHVHDSLPKAEVMSSLNCVVHEPGAAAAAASTSPSVRINHAHGVTHVHRTTHMHTPPTHTPPNHPLPKGRQHHSLRVPWDS